MNTPRISKETFLKIATVSMIFWWVHFYIRLVLFGRDLVELVLSSTQCGRGKHAGRQAEGSPSKLTIGKRRVATWMNEWMNAWNMCKGVECCWNILLMSRFRQFQVHIQPYIIGVRHKGWIIWLLPSFYDPGEPAVSYKWTGWVWEITGWCWRLQENYWSF